MHSYYFLRDFVQIFLFSGWKIAVFLMGFISLLIMNSKCARQKKIQCNIILLFMSNYLFNIEDLNFATLHFFVDKEYKIRVTKIEWQKFIHNRVQTFLFMKVLNCQPTTMS